MKTQALIASVCIAFSAFSANASSYLGLNLGQANINSADVDSSYSQHSVDINESALSGELYAGYNFNQYIALEVVGGNIGSANVEYGNMSLELANIMYVGAQPKVTIPLGYNISVFAKAGVALFNLNANYVIEENSGSTSGKHTNTTFSPIYGLGAEYALNDRFTIQATWEYLNPEFDLTEAFDSDLPVTATLNVQQVFIGASYNF